MGRALQNIEGMLTMPYGCGEQNMARLAPNIYILEYLKSTQQLTKAIMEKASNFLTSGEFTVKVFFLECVNVFLSLKHENTEFVHRDFCFSKVKMLSCYSVTGHLQWTPGSGWGAKTSRCEEYLRPLTFTGVTGSTYCSAETLDYFNCQCFWSDGEIIYWLISDTHFSKPFMLFEIQTWELLAFLPITQESNSTFPYTICLLDLQLLKDFAKCIALRSNRGCNTDRIPFSQACFPSCVFTAFLIYIADFSSHNWSFSECTTDLTCTSHYTRKCVLL